jgi:hypothetical protein
MEIKPIHWIKREDMEWEDGQFLLAVAKVGYINLPVIVRDFGNGYVEAVTEPFLKHPVEDFTHYAVITEP